MSRRIKLHDGRIILPTREPPALLEGDELTKQVAYVAYVNSILFIYLLNYHIIHRIK